MSHLTVKKEEKTGEQIFRNMNFVITGSVEHFANRAQAKEFIESLGGKVTGSVTSKTNYLINNDTTSNSSKNKKKPKNWEFQPFGRRFPEDGTTIK